MHIGIAGAGILGRLLAWRLSQTGEHKIEIFDKDPIDSGMASSYTAAGMLTPYSEVESAEWDIFNLGMESLSLWPAIINSLGAYCDRDIPFVQKGSLVVAHKPDQGDFLRFKQQLLHKKVLGDFKPEVDAQTIQRLEPELAHVFQQALYLPQESWICPQSTMSNLAVALINAGVIWHAEENIHSIRAKTLTSKQQTYHFDSVIDCRGLGAKNDVNQLRGVRGELMWLQAPEVNIKHMVRLMHPRYRLYLVPRGHDNIYVLGATQIESEDYSPMSVRSSLELLSAVYSLHPGFAEARVLEMKSNCRPAFSDNLPKIKVQDGLIQANGLFRHGYLLAPIVVENVRSYLSDGRMKNANLFSV